MFVSTDSQKVEQQLFERLVAARTQIYAELSKTIVGQREVIDVKRARFDNVDKWVIEKARIFDAEGFVLDIRLDAHRGTHRR